MKQLIPLIALALFCSVAQADARRGQSLHDNNCTSCHSGIMGGRADDIYVRENRRIEDYDGLVRQVNRCNDNLDVPWHDDEVMDVVEYLNKTYYHFKQAH